MDEGKFAADFISKNLDKILELAVKVYGKADAAMQVSLKTAYRDYLDATEKKYAKSKSFFIRHEPVDLYTYYEPTGIRCGETFIAIPTFRSVINTSKRITVIGSGGSGKSVLMRHLFLDCMKDNTYAPILIELRDLNAEGKSLDDIVAQTLETYGFKVSGDYVKRAKQAGHLCYFLDGYDEVTPSLRTKLGKEIINLSKRFPNCPIILSSRPDDVFKGIEDFHIFHMSPLELGSATRLISKLPFDDVIKGKFISALEGGLFEQHQSFLSNPLLLSIMLLTYSENAEIPSKISIFYNQAYEALFQRHDAYKGGFSRTRMTSLDIQDFAKVFSLFALQSYEKRLFKMPRTQCLEFIEKGMKGLGMDFKPEEFLTDLISAACLLVEDGLEIAFSHRSFQEYFVARHISQAVPDVQERLIDRYWQNMRFDNVIYLLLEMNPDLVERKLIIPKLEKLFAEIGVKRSVGVTHATRCFKKFYSAIVIDDFDLQASGRNMKAEEHAILHLAVMHCDTYESPGAEFFKDMTRQFQEKFGEPGKRISIETKDLTSRSPVLRELFRGGVFSPQYLDAGYKALKKLKTKQMNTIQNLDNLLGI